MSMAPLVVLLSAMLLLWQVLQVAGWVVVVVVAAPGALLGVVPVGGVMSAAFVALSGSDWSSVCRLLSCYPGLGWWGNSV